jgi:hypothetical protein
LSKQENFRMEGVDDKCVFYMHYNGGVFTCI